MSNYKSPKKKVTFSESDTWQQVLPNQEQSKWHPGQGCKSSQSEHRPSSVGQGARGDGTPWAHTGAVQSLALLTLPQKSQHDP